MPTSIVIVTYNGAKWITAALQSCNEAKSVHEVIVVDNASTDETCHLITSQFPNVKLMRQDRNKGFGIANNIGIAEALKSAITGVFLLNQDAKLSSECVHSIEQSYFNEPNQGIISPIQLNYSGTELHRGFAGYLATNGRNILTDGLRGNLKNTYDFPNSPAALWWLPVSTLRDVGGFDPLFFLYCEDADLAKRVSENKLRLTVCTSAYAMHDDSPGIRSAVTERRLLLSQQLIQIKYSNTFRFAITKSLIRIIRRSFLAFVKLKPILGIETAGAALDLLIKIPDLTRDRRRSSTTSQFLYLEQYTNSPLKKSP